METLRTRLITLVCPSHWMADRARESAMFRDSRIEVIPNGVDTQIFRPLPKSEARRSLNLPPDDTLILFAAHNANEKRKGFRELVQALKACAQDPSVQARARRNQISLVCVGHPSKELASVGLPVMPLGFVRSEEKLNQAYAAADVFVQSSLEDNFPNTMIESMSAGTPVIAFAVGGIPEAVVEGHTGKLIPRDRINGLAEGLLNASENPLAWSKLGENCREKVLREYSVTLQASRYASLYRSLLANQPGKK
jgi:glycosyltransferase involved in cell wall biosynthesis